ncbi:MAG: leucine-rich repeat domain-containing protein [Ruminococcus flavefaciens]|nr:leucine-rich repeat domain-containing protein [Ruminococcus flavefaciens]
MKIIKKILLCAFMGLCVLSLVSCANSGYCGAEENKHNVKWKLDDDGTLTISGTGEMASYNNVLGNPAEWFDYRNNIERVVIEDGVTNIGEQAFNSCSHITEVVIPDSVTDIGKSAFCFCGSLTKVNIPENVTVIRYATFSGCTGLRDIVIPDSVQTIETLAFDGCVSLKDVTVPENLTDFGQNPFKDTALSEEKMKQNEPLIINNILIDGSKCTGDVVVPDGVTKIGDSAFDRFVDDNEGLISVTLLESVESIGVCAFSCCPNLERINIPENLKTIDDYAFFQCKKLKDKLTLPESVEYIGDDVFKCSELNMVSPLIIEKGTV